MTGDNGAHTHVHISEEERERVGLISSTRNTEGADVVADYVNRNWECAGEFSCMGDPDEPIDPADMVYGYGYKHEEMDGR